MDCTVPLNFHPGPGTIVICDFSSGFRPPEMVKVRPVVVISPRRRVNQLVTVIPLSSTAPVPVEPWHYLLPPGAYPASRAATWAKCDMISTVGVIRLDRVKTKINGCRVYETFRLAQEDLDAILMGVRAALRLT